MQTILNQSLQLSLPEGFRQMDDAELQQLNHPAAETLSVKQGKAFYYIHCYMREAMLEKSLATLDEILASMSWE